MSMKNLEELKVELAYLIEMNHELYEKNVLPVMNMKIEEFLNAFEDYFRERGFVVRRKDDSVIVSFDILHFKAAFNENHEIFIMKGREQIALIQVKFNGEDELKEDFDGESAAQIEMEIEKQKQITAYLKKPEVFYAGGESGPRFDNPLTLLMSIFNV
ncbi:hypothetical protein [Neobacillus mesonae]|uniref:hypothetical protein n=1 Tax=Neobacillus mesonae TaxID=1193713 RepID=UPI0025741F7F|nr:hypothetical protein [Neobacillus mesonae]